MNVKEIRNKMNLTQKEFASKYSISLRTLQEWEQGRSEPPCYLIEYLKKQYIPSNLKIDNVYPFYVTIDDKFFNCEKIYPTQQKKIYKILKSLIDINNINKIIVFGSSVNYKCHVESDVDLYIEMKENKESIDKKKIDFELDLWNNFTVDEHLLDEIKKTGVIVYER